MKIHEQITKETWMQHGSNPEDYQPKCALGWFIWSYNSSKSYKENRNKLCGYIGTSDIVAWNDDPSRTFEEIYKAFKDCDL